MDCQVQWLGGPGDGGIDLLLVRCDETFAVQVKRKADSRSKIPVSLIREFVGALVIEGVPNGIFVTTSSFTHVAETTAIRAWHRGGIERVDLVDGERLVDLCGLSTRSNSPHAVAGAFESNISAHVGHGFSQFVQLADTSFAS